jgi:hypothetical protein
MRYIVAEEELGVFLGAFKNHGVFAKTDIFGISKAFSFKTEEDAKGFIDDYAGEKKDTWKIIEIKTNSKYVGVIDLIKNGHEKYTHGMIDSIHMYSTELH